MHRKGVLQHLDSEQFCDIFLEKYNAEALLLWASKYVQFSDFVACTEVLSVFSVINSSNVV